MQKNEKKYKIDEFWNDCMPSNIEFYENELSLDINNKTCNIKSLKKNISNKKNFPFKKKTNQNNPSLNETDYLKSKLISTTQSSHNNLKNIQEALKREEYKPKNPEKKYQKFIDLYKKEKINKELLYKKNNSQRQIKENLKLEECTFKPKKCKNKKIDKKINKLFSDSNIYERNIKKQQKYNEKIALLFNENNKISNNHRSSECFFHPNIINNNNYENILYSNIWNDHVNNYSNKLFLLRYMKAREEEYYKKELLNSPINLKIRLKKNYSYPRKFVRTLSEKDSLAIKKKLHNTLNSLRNIFTEEDEDFLYEKNFCFKEEKENNSINVGKKVDNLQWTFAKKNEL
jgi:hypothetical protein